MRKVPIECRATIGEVSNSEHNLEKLGKAGASRRRGINPTVRVSAMNTVDHPHGGGKARPGPGTQHPVYTLGHPTKGYKTTTTSSTNENHVSNRSDRVVRPH